MIAIVGSATRFCFVDELELVLVARVGAEADAERVEHRVALGELLLDLGDPEIDELVVIDGHEDVPGRTSDGGGARAYRADD